MSDEQKKPDPVDDLKKGIGLLFRAAKTAVDQLPTGKLEKVVVSGVKEVGRAIENVTDQIDRQVFGGKGTVPHPEDQAPPAEPPAEAKKDGEQVQDEKKDEPPVEEKDKDKIDPDEEPPRGPRVA
jgi:hypothetical protein